MIWRALLVYCLSVYCLLPGSQAQAAAPNVLIIIADDCTYNDLPLYGGKNAQTPYLDQLAKESLTFNRAYLAEAMCQPCRAELFTGMYPLSNGCAWNHSASRPSVKSMPQRMGQLGYRVGIAGKIHVKPDNVFPFENVDGFDKSCTRNPTHSHSLSGIESFITRKNEEAEKAEPFCLVVALVDPHVPWVMGDASAYPPKKLKLPPHLADTPVTREAFSRYLAEITYMDGQVGEILDVLEQSGKKDDTLVLFTSEQGAQFPGCKWTNWDTGLHTALMARWPNKIPAGKRTDAMVQYADVLPTLLELADAEVPDELDGTSFKNVLLEGKNEHREYVYGIHNNIPEGPSYPIRTIFDGEFRYIRNLSHEEIYIEKHLMGNRGGSRTDDPYWPTWVFNAWQRPDIYKLVKRYTSRPTEEFYDTANDPYEMENLANESAFQERKTSLSAELNRWMIAQGDPGVPIDSHEAHQAAKKGKHIYFPDKE